MTIDKTAHQDLLRDTLEALDDVLSKLNLLKVVH